MTNEPSNNQLTLVDAQSGKLLPYMPMPQAAAVGALTGYGVGFATRTFGSVVIKTLGSLFAAVQLLNYFGYLDKNKMQRDLAIGVSAIQSQMGAEPTTLEQRVKNATKRVVQIIKNNSIITSLFAAGFVAAFR